MGNKQVDNAQFQLQDMNHIITQVATFNQRLLENIHIETHFSPIPLIKGNRFQLEQIFQNMIVNAKDALPNGGKISFTTAQENDTVVIHIQDNGQGIAPEIIDHIFEPFVSTKVDGNGLGLFIIFGIVQRHGGTIHVESAIGTGTTFTIRLPIATT